MRINYKEDNTMKREHKMIIKQRLFGVCMLLVTLAIPFLTGGDGTACIVTLPISVAMLCSNDIIIMD